MKAYTLTKNILGYDAARQLITNVKSVESYEANFIFIPMESERHKEQQKSP